MYLQGSALCSANPDNAADFKWMLFVRTKYERGLEALHLMTDTAIDWFNTLKIIQI